MERKTYHKNIIFPLAYLLLMASMGSDTTQIIQLKYYLLQLIETVL